MLVGLIEAETRIIGRDDHVVDPGVALVRRGIRVLNAIAVEILAARHDLAVGIARGCPQSRSRRRRPPVTSAPVPSSRSLAFVKLALLVPIQISIGRACVGLQLIVTTPFSMRIKPLGPFGLVKLRVMVNAVPVAVPPSETLPLPAFETMFSVALWALARNGVNSIPSCAVAVAGDLRSAGIAGDREVGAVDAAGGDAAEGEIGSAVIGHP